MSKGESSYSNNYTQDSGKGDSPDDIDRKGISEEKPEELEEQATAQAYQTSQLLRGNVRAFQI